MLLEKGHFESHFAIHVSFIINILGESMVGLSKHD